MFILKGEKEEYKAKAVIEIGVDGSNIKEGSVAFVQESQGKKIQMDKQDDSLKLRDKDLVHAGTVYSRYITAKTVF